MIELFQSLLIPIERDWKPEMGPLPQDRPYRTPRELLVLLTGEEVLLEDEVISTVDTLQKTGTHFDPEAAQESELPLESATVL